MQTFEIETMPQIQFAHFYHAENYSIDIYGRENCMEIVFPSEGSLHVRYNEEECTVYPGDLLCICNESSIFHIRSQGYHEHHTVMAKFKWSRQNHMNGLYLPLHTPAQLGTGTAINIIDQLIRKPLFFRESPTNGSVMFLNLLCEIDQCNRKTKKLNLPSEVLYVQRAKEYVQAHIRTPITQKDTAQYLGISPEYLCAVFKKNEGISFIKYTNTRKLEAIQLLMEKENAHLYEAAAFLGFSDPNYVSRLFKKYYGYNITEKLKPPV